VRTHAWKRTTVQDPQAKTAHIENHMLDDQGKRDFTATLPGTRLVGDITYLRTGEGWLYLATVIDLFSGMVIGWAMAEHMRASLCTAALQMARNHGHFAGHSVVFHSDRGTQGVFNRSKQHLITEVLDAVSKSSEAGTSVSRADPFTGSAVGGLARGPGTVLDRDRLRCEDPGRRRRGGRVRARRASLVPARWRCESSAGPDTVRTVSVLERP
jgi:hypothetical protein